MTLCSPIVGSSKQVLSSYPHPLLCLHILQVLVFEVVDVASQPEPEDTADPRHCLSVALISYNCCLRKTGLDKCEKLQLVKQQFKVPSSKILLVRLVCVYVCVCVCVCERRKT